MNRTNRHQSSSNQTGRHMESLEERRLMHAEVEYLDPFHNFAPGGSVRVLHIHEVTPGTNDSFVIDYNAASNTITALHNGKTNHPGSTDYPINVNTFDQIFIDTGAGNDAITINSLPAGKQLTIYAGDGNDAITVNTTVNGAIISGDAGNDGIYDGSGGSYLFGGTGNDTIYGFGGNDTIHGNEGNDYIFGGGGADYLFGDQDSDVVSDVSDDVTDFIDGGSGDDLVIGGRGADYVHGGEGNDTIHAGGWASIAHIYGDAGYDTADADLTDVIDSSTERVFGVADAFESNDTTATATNLGTINSSNTQSHATLHQSDLGDRYKFVAGISGIASIDATFSLDSYSSPVKLVLYDASGTTQLAVATGIGHDGAHLSAKVTSGNTYYLGVFKASPELKGSRDYGFTIGIKKGTYLSDLTPTSATNGWGAYEKDKSNGEAGSGDGHTLTLNGQAYAKGLGVVPSSVLQYQLDKKYNRFVADVGVDDEITTVGTVKFKVYGDGAILYQSSINVTPTSSIAHIDVSVTGVTKLRLEVTDGGDGITNDHADWADARLLVNPFIVLPITLPISFGGSSSITSSSAAGTGLSAHAHSDVLYRTDGLL